MSYFAAIFIVGMIILLHEAGHFAAARAVSIPVQVFSIGFGPALLKFRRGETEYRLSLVPLGGYVLPLLADENDYFAIPVYRRVVLSLGGPAANIITTFVCFGILNALAGESSFFALLLRPMEQTAGALSAMVFSLAGVFSRPEQLSGIIGIVNQGGSFIAGGAINIVKFTGLMSLNLAVINLLPIPSLDGGKVILCLLEKIHPRLRKLHVPMAVAGWVMILGILAYTTIIDIGRLA